MFGSRVLEVAIGLMFCFGTVALIVSALQEALASILRMRANSLLGGVKSMLNDPNFSALAQAVYAHPLVNPHGDGTATEEGSLKSKPSYIEPANFAIALVDSIQQTPGDFSSLGEAIDAIPDPQIRRVMQGLYRRAGDLPQFQKALAAWFDNAMERLSGAYKRKQLLISLAMSFGLAALFNIDTIHLFSALWQQPLPSQISTVPGGLTPETLQTLFALPIGWTSFPSTFNELLEALKAVTFVGFVLKLVGLMVTAATTLFGAPFWFDLLQRAVQMRGTGTKPQDTPRVVVLDGALAVQAERPAKPVAVASA